MRVLVVDDFAMLAEHLASLLRRKGYTVRVAFDGAEALRVAEGFEPKCAGLRCTYARAEWLRAGGGVR